MYSKAIIGTHCYVPIAELRGGVSEAKKRLTAISKYDDDDGNRLTVPLYDDSNSKRGWFGIPRHYFNTIPAKEIIYKDSIGSPAVFTFRSSPGHPKYPMQQSLVGRFVDNVQGRKVGFVIVAKTGFGKTAVGLECIQKLGRTALIIVPKEDLLGQWKRRINKHTDLKPEEVGIIQRDQCDFKGKKIVIAMMHSLTLRKTPYPKELYDYFGAVLQDEAHKCGAKQLGKATVLFNARYRIGMSATPKRKDGINQVLDYHFGQVVLSATDDDMPTPKVILKYLPDTPPVRHYPGAGKMAKRARVISALSKNKDRNYRLASFIRAMHRKGRKTVVFSDRLQQLDFLQSVIVKEFGIPSEIVGKYIGGMPDKERTMVANKCRIILATYQSMDMGTDIPTLDALVFATPRSDVVQSVGRILRYMQGKKQPVVLDVVDPAIPECLVMSKMRQKKYQESGYSIIKLAA